MNKKFLTIVPLLSIVVGCGEISNTNDGPRSDELISSALNEVNFINYVVQAKHHSEELGDFYTVATITPVDLSFKTKKSQLLYTTEHSYYYFDKVEESYDVYYKNKLTNNKSYLGNSYFGRFNRNDVIEDIPNSEDIFSHYNVFNINSLEAEDFTYNKNLNGWYILNEDSYSDTISNFFNLDSSHSIMRFNLQVSKNRINSIDYEIKDGDNQTIKNELFYTYPVDYLQESQFSLINAVSVEKLEASLELTVDTSSEQSSTSEAATSSEQALSSEDSTSLIDTTSEDTLTSEVETSSEDISTSQPPTTSEDLTTSTPPITSEENNTSEDDITYVDRLNFSIYDDASIFANNRYTIQSIQLFENYDYAAINNTAIATLEQGQEENVRERSITLNRRLKRGSRYLLRINLASTPNGQSEDYYDYSFIY